MGRGVRIEGLEALKKKLKANVTMQDVRRVVRHNGLEMTNKMTRNAEFSKGYQTGQTKRSIPPSMKMEDNGMKVSVHPTTEYASYVEYGTRFMEPQPFVKPAYDKQKQLFKRDMEKLMR